MTRHDLEFTAPQPPLDQLPFSEAVRVGDLVFLCGQLGFSPGTAEIVSGGIDIEARQVMENLKAALERAGTSLDRVVKCTVYLADISDWPQFNEVYVEYFQSGRMPARTAVQAGLALGARVELDCFASLPK